MEQAIHSSLPAISELHKKYSSRDTIPFYDASQLSPPACHSHFFAISARLFGIRLVRYRNENKCGSRNQYGTYAIMISSIELECSVTGQRCRILNADAQQCLQHTQTHVVYSIFNHIILVSLHEIRLKATRNYLASQAAVDSSMPFSPYV